MVFIYKICTNFQNCNGWVPLCRPKNFAVAMFFLPPKLPPKLCPLLYAADEKIAVTSKNSAATAKC